MQIDSDALLEVTAGVKWGAAFSKAFDWADKGATIGTLGGLAVGSVVPGVGSVAGAGIGGTAGTIGGFGAGLVKGIHDTWGQ